MTTIREQRDTDEVVLRRYGGHSVGTLTNVLYIVALGVIEASLLFSYYMIRHESPQWPPEGYDAPSLLGVSTALATLLASAVPLVFAYRAVRRDRVERLFLSLGAVFLLAATFFSVQAISYAGVDIQPVDHVYSALIVAMAGFHLVIALIGVVMSGLVWYRAITRKFHSGQYLAIETLLFTWGFVVFTTLLTAGTIYLNPYL